MLTALSLNGSPLYTHLFSPLFVSSDFHSPGLKDAGQLSESSYAKAPHPHPPHGDSLHIYGLCWVVKDQLTRHFYQAAAAQDKLAKYCVLVQSKVWDGTSSYFLSSFWGGPGFRQSVSD